MRRTFKATRANSGERIDRFLLKAMSGTVLDFVRELCLAGRVSIGGKPVKVVRKLWGNEQIDVELPPPTPVQVSPDAPEVPVLFHDEDLLVVDKPVGIVVELEGNGRSVVEILGARVGGCDVGGLLAPGVAHRLDRDTTGCLALARSDDALALLKKLFETKRVHKRYLGLVLGEPPDQGRIETPYGRDPKDPRRFTTRVESARRAALSYAVCERFGGEAALLEVSLETGRTHQIRVQLAEAGFPIVADGIYGTEAARAHPAAQAIGRQALHARSLRLPVREGSEVSLEAKLPADFERALAVLRRGPAGP